MKICTQCTTEHPDAWCDFKPGIGWVCFDCLAEEEFCNCSHCGKTVNCEELEVKNINEALCQNCNKNENNS